MHGVSGIEFRSSVLYRICPYFSIDGLWLLLPWGILIASVPDISNIESGFCVPNPKVPREFILFKTNKLEFGSFLISLNSKKMWLSSVITPSI